MPPQSLGRHLDIELQLIAHPQFVYAVRAGAAVGAGQRTIEHRVDGSPAAQAQRPVGRRCATCGHSTLCRTAAIAASSSAHTACAIG